MFLAQDLTNLVAQGHELGCHTFSHCHSWNTSPQVFEDAVIENREALSKFVPGASFPSMSYPISGPKARTKQKMSKHFLCCRGGGQTFNAGTTDLNYLLAHFLEQSRDNPEAIKRVIDQNSQANGWLIFATHDVSEQPTRFGCTPELFKDIVQYAVNSGARILPVAQAYEVLQAANHRNQPA
jgi:peptidoglycan/xylan/chitin deacetylase (PgdA/CDA1 family)